jgi:phosphomevalonate kinase
MKLRTPGKLFLAGEYAVLHAGQPGIVLAVDRWLHLRSEPAAAHRLEIPAWGLDFQGVDAPAADEPISARGDYVRRLYAAVLGRLPEAGHRHLVAEPHDGDLLARDLGLGSSAALAVALVRGLQSPTSPAGLKIACGAHLETQNGRGSGLDVAACWAGRSILARSGAGMPPKIRELAPPHVMHLGVLHTGRKARTAGALSTYASFSAVRRAEDERFRSRSSLVVARTEAALKKSPRALVGAIDEASRLLAGLAAQLGEATPVPEHLLAAVKAAGGAVKSCGALGGDCLCIVAPSPAGLERARALAVSAGCEDLGLRPLFEVPR